MADINLPANREDLYDELDRTASESRQPAWRKYREWLRENDQDLIKGFHPYIESLKNGFINRRGEQQAFAATSWNARLDAAKDRILYAFDRSPDAGDRNKKAQLKAYLDEAPRQKVRRTAITSERYLEWPAVQKLIAKCKQDPPTGDPKLAPMIEFMARTGVRVDEMVNIRLTDIKMNGVYAYIRIHGKGRVERTNEVEKAFVQQLMDFYKGATWLFEHSGRQYSTRSLTNRVKIVSGFILGKTISCHALRHSYARHQIVDLGRDAKSVAVQLGHSSAAITMDYYVDAGPTGDPMFEPAPDVFESDPDAPDIIKKLNDTFIPLTGKKEIRY